MHKHCPFFFEYTVDFSLAFFALLWYYVSC